MADEIQTNTKRIKIERSFGAVYKEKHPQIIAKKIDRTKHFERIKNMLDVKKLPEKQKPSKHPIFDSETSGIFGQLPKMNLPDDVIFEQVEASRNSRPTVLQDQHAPVSPYKLSKSYQNERVILNGKDRSKARLHFLRVAALDFMSK